ncbi:hypothetical protein EUZ85_15765 [Hahella sp. KA22]|uniref:hypothetical protein n=1 Tax=Hahella sp. KA22 TaxID=1628392 RepID=UPI000FDF388B|nr:hypothetical protein [Hahella sp. KA22]AZZ92105.1 hypothetical protein ENC22_13200 [Hahella sp. KA22]QAY55475.1 hypothetical protein EUZ85_15765 [Hahella sp. KA22]
MTKKALFLLASIFVSQLSSAAEYPGAFKIKKIIVSRPDNFHFRVVTDSNNSDYVHCSGGPTNPAWSYVNEADPGSKTMMSTLLAAYMGNKTVTVVTEGVDTNAGRQCKIIELELSD